MDLIESAEQLVGSPYRLGAPIPSPGTAVKGTPFDCGSFIVYLLNSVGITGYNRYVPTLATQVQPITRTDLRPGDLVFSTWPGDSATPGHVALYVGDGEMVEAGSPSTGVHTATLGADYLSHVNGYGRVQQLGGIAESAGFVSSSAQALKFVQHFFTASTYVRAGAGLLGVVFLVVGLGVVISGAGS